jgi:hypothetical protein
MPLEADGAQCMAPKEIQQAYYEIPVVLNNEYSSMESHAFPVYEDPDP